MLGAMIFLAGLGILLWVCYDFVSRYRPQWLGQGPPRPAVIATTIDQQTGPADYDLPAIINAHIFGKPVEEKTAVVQQAPATTLKVNLVGVLSSDDERYARALISVGSRGTNSYAVGAQVAGTDAKIHRVESERVILDRGGKYEMLAMVRKDITKQVVGQ